MVDKLGSLTRVIAALRNGVNSGGKAHAAGTPAGKNRSQRLDSQASRAAGTQLESLGLRLRAVEASDPQRRRKVLRLFVEAVLLDELGEELLLSGDFQQLVDRTLREMENNESAADVLNQAFDDLVRNS